MAKNDPIPRLKRPQDAGAHEIGIVHLGLGAFFRAFGCVYIADAMAKSGGNWGVVGVSLRSASTRDALEKQDWSYTAASLGQDGIKPRIINVLNGVLVAPEDPAAVLAQMADPGVKIVSLTVTEKGYCYNPSNGSLNLDHPDIQHDLNNALPVSAPGFLVRALQMRRSAGVEPFTVLTCDNLPQNGKLVRGIVLSLAEKIDPALAQWIASNAYFPSTMVDRITPATTPADIAQLAEMTGYHDEAPVMHEPFSQWVIEDRFVGSARPDFAAAGGEMVDDVTAFEQMKLRMLNGTHSALAYTGYLAGHETIADAIHDPVFAAYVRQLWAEIMPAVAAPKGVHLKTYANALLGRYANSAIRHRTWQIAMDGSQKLPQRILETVRENIHANRSSAGLFLAIAAWMRYVEGTDEAGNTIDVRDPLVEELQQRLAPLQTPAQKVAALLAVREIFPANLAEALREPVTEAAELLRTLGARAAIEKVTQ